MSNLFAHQQRGAQWLAERSVAILGDAPGVGKTRTLLRGLQLIGAQKPLIICPAIARTHWWQEIRTLGCTFDPMVVSYDKVVRDDGPLSRIVDASDHLILDECHMVRTPSAQRTKIILGRNGYARRIHRVWAASGTPMWKTPDNLWTILSTLFPRVVAEHGCTTANQWREKFCKYRMVNVGGGRYVPKVYAVNNASELREIMDTVMLRRTMSDVGLDVPEIFWQPWVVDADVSSEIRDAENALVTASDPSRVDELRNGDPHVARLRRLVGEAKVGAVAAALADQLTASNEKIVVFAHHRRVLGQLALLLGPYGVAYVDGDTSQDARDEAIRAFQHGTARVFVGQTIACHTAITLTAAHRVVLVEPDWTANVNYQAAKRVARIGQTSQHCVAQMVSLAGTLDEAIVRQNLREVRIAEEVFCLQGGPANGIPSAEFARSAVRTSGGAGRSANGGDITALPALDA